MRVASGPHLPPAAVQTVLGDHDRSEGPEPWKRLASEAMGEPEGLPSFTSIYFIQLQPRGRFEKGALTYSFSSIIGAGAAIVMMAALDCSPRVTIPTRFHPNRSCILGK